MKPFQKLKLTICVPLTTAAHNKDPKTQKCIYEAWWLIIKLKTYVIYSKKT